ncbi:MAG: transglutaminase family protein, partial [Gammaproteobacteria bacterium]
MNNDNTQLSGALIGSLRQSGWTMRSIALVIILTFGGLVTSPAVAAVKQEVQKIQWHKTEEGPGAKLSARIQAVHDRLDTLTRKGLKGSSLADMRKQLASDADDLAGLDKDTLASFAATRTMIQDKHLPDVIMQREVAAETHYKIEMTALRQGLAGIASETDDAKAQADSKYVLDRLSKFQMQRSQQKFDPKNLPNRSLKPDLSRKPFTTKKQFADAGFTGNPRLMVATTAPNFDYSQLPGANNPAYLAATTEVTLSPAIQAQAAALHNNPVEIYNWVRNNIQWQPTWGAVQDADLTLSAQRGNAFDISSLLIALLRASNIPARYVLGTINVPQDKFRNWVGGFQNINAAVNFASAGGIPIKSLYSGGQITTIQMQH